MTLFLVNVSWFILKFLILTWSYMVELTRLDQLNHFGSISLFQTRFYFR